VVLPPPLRGEGCLFCRIVAAEERADIVLDEPDAVAFLDFRPVFPGHCLLVPRDHHETLADLPADLIGSLFATAQRLARAVEAGMEADGTFVAMNNKISQSVPHFHVHVVPRRRKDGLRGFFWPRQRYVSDDQRAQVADRLRKALAANFGC
jgi:histidine triad (HIT) family protein